MHLALSTWECQTCHKVNQEAHYMDLQPLGDRLIVEVLEEEQMTVSGIVLPDTAKEKPQRGRVLAVGPGSRNDNGELVPMDVAVGDEVIFSKYGGTEVKLGTDEVLILRESDVLAKAVSPAPKTTKKKELAGSTA
jgi:chaperonin GroES